MKYLVKAEVLGGKVHTYTTEADHSAEAMSEAYDKFGVCAVTVGPAPEGGPSVDSLTRYDHRGCLMAPDSAGDYVLVSDVRDLLTASMPAIDAAIAVLDALLAERRDAIAQKNAA